MSEPATSGHTCPPIDWGDASGRRYTNAEMVSITGVPASSIHHYLKLGLIPRPERTTADSFVYDERHVAALDIVRRLRQRGCTLDEVRHALAQVWTVDLDQLETALAAYVTTQPSPPDPRARLIEAAVVAFAQQGYGEVTVAAICSCAQVAKGTFYRYFNNKDELFLAAAGSVVDRAVAAFGAGASAGAAGGDGSPFSAHLRSGLPLLFELAKCSLRDSGLDARVAVSLFVDFVERLGRVIAPDSSAAEQTKQGGVVVMFAVVEIFARLLDSELAQVSGSSG